MQNARWCGWSAGIPACRRERIGRLSSLLKNAHRKVSMTEALWQAGKPADPFSPAGYKPIVFGKAFASSARSH
jgi:hypothetical protein